MFIRTVLAVIVRMNLAFVGRLIQGGPARRWSLPGGLVRRIARPGRYATSQAVLTVLCRPQGSTLQVPEATMWPPCQACLMDTPGQLTRKLYEFYQARNWAAAADLLHPEALLEMPATRETTVGRDKIIELQANYPEPWGNLTVLRVVGDDRENTAAVELEIKGLGVVFRCAAFWIADQGMLTRGMEYWVTVGGEQPGPRPKKVPA